MRARQLGLRFGPHPTGANNAITDVDGVRVGHATVIERGVRTGVTAVVPPGEDLLRQPRRAAAFVANGHTKSIGLQQFVELGELETPILLTGTLSAFAVADGLLRWVLDRQGNGAVRTVNPIVAETNEFLFVVKTLLLAVLGRAGSCRGVDAAGGRSVLFGFGSG